MGKFYYLIFLLFTLLCLVELPAKVHAQSYGVGFYGHEVDQDARTGLDLTPAEPLCFNDNFELLFDFSFLQGKSTYFGYILRIIENDRRNFDLVYDNDADAFNFIIGEELTKITFNIPKEKLFNRWNKLRINFNVNKGVISLMQGNQTLTHHVNLNKKGCYKVLFGANSYRNFGTSDVPPMKVREIRINNDKELKYYWPLNEKSGLEAKEHVNGKNNAKLFNPIWLKASHYYWQLIKTFTVNGWPSTAFNPNNDELFVVAQDTLYIYNSRNANISANKYTTGGGLLNIGNQSIYNGIESRLYNFYPDNNFITGYNGQIKGFDKPFVVAPITDYIQINKFISNRDSSLYFMGGYGHHQYKNTIKQYNFNTGLWNIVKPKGDFFTPRYLAGLGTTANGDTAYIIGGYGNSSGQQILKPKNLYDMMRFTVKDHRFEKLFDIKPKNGDFVFANSLIINKKDNSYYGLIFPEMQFDSKLQLIKGSLKNSTYTLVGNTIPYSFNDIRSYADVFYSPTIGKFLVVTMLRTMDDKRTTIKIYGLAGPPETADTPLLLKPSRSYLWLWIVAAVVSFLAILYAFKNFKKRSKPRSSPVADVERATKKQVIPVAEPSTATVETSIFVPETQKPQIYLFGELQLVTKDGEEIVNSFTRLTKELFVCLFTQSVRWNRGVSAEKLIEILWFDKDEKSARNNRSVNMAKLKNVLDQLGPCVISRTTGYYKIDTDYTVINVDYYNYLKIVLDKNKLSKEKITQLAEITQRGSFLSNCEYEWLDQHKTEVTDEIIDTYLRYIHNSKIEDDPEFCIKVSNYIFQHDHVNEEAMRIKCKALVYLGKHSLAKSTFENFRKEYKSIYLEDFKQNYNSILE